LGSLVKVETKCPKGIEIVPQRDNFNPTFNLALPKAFSPVEKVPAGRMRGESCALVFQGEGWVLTILSAVVGHVGLRSLPLAYLPRINTPLKQQQFPNRPEFLI